MGWKVKTVRQLIISPEAAVTFVKLFKSFHSIQSDLLNLMQ